MMMMEKLKYRWKRNINIIGEWRNRKKEGKGIFYYINEDKFERE